MKISKEDKNIFKNSLGALLVKGAAIIVNFLMLRIYMKYFEDQTILGIWLTMLSILTWFLMFDLGLGNGLRNKLPAAIEKKNNGLIKQYISSAYIFLSILSLFFWIIGIVVFQFLDWNSVLNISQDYISDHVLVTCLRIIYTGLMIQLVLKIITSILYAYQMSWIVNLLVLCSNVLIMVMVLITPTESAETNLFRISIINVLAVNLPLVIATIYMFGTKLKKCRPNFSSFVKKYAHEIFSEGIILLWLSIVFMVISSTNEFLISHFTNPGNVVQYQAYYKIYNGISSIFVVLLVPIWSAVTKAKVEEQFKWIEKLHNRLIFLSFAILLVNLLVIPILQMIMDMWLGMGSVEVNVGYAILFAISNFIFVIHNVNTSFGNGFSYYKIQNLWMGFAAVVDIPLAFFLVKFTGGWIGIVIANVIALLPFEILEPIYFKRELRKKSEI